MKIQPRSQLVRDRRRATDPAASEKDIIFKGDTAMSVIWFKIWSDIWNNKGRTAQVVLIIAMGAFAIGMIITTREVVNVRLAEVWRASASAVINLWANPWLDDEQLTALKSIKGVTDVEGYLSTNVEWRLGPDEPWTSGGLIARADYQEQTYARLTLLDGHWPSRKRVAVEKGADGAFNIHQGQQVAFRINDHEYTVQVGGVVFNPSVDAPALGGQAQFYASRDEFANLTGEENFNQILAGAPVYDEVAIKGLADRMQRRLEKLDVETGGAAPTAGDQRIQDPGQHPAQNILDGIFLILGVMGGLALILGLLLVYNTITAVVGQQITQIGIMKAIGAGAGRILLIYFSGVLIYGGLALLVAIPLSALGAQQLSNFLLYFFNLDPGHLIPTGDSGPDRDCPTDPATGRARARGGRGADYCARSHQHLWPGRRGRPAGTSVSRSAPSLPLGFVDS